jgi:hypothetical protein
VTGKRSSPECVSRRAIRRGGRTTDVRREAIREEIAEQYHLKVVQGKIPIPDLRIEYADQEMMAQRRDLELATDHYRPRHRREPGFQIYARSNETDRLRRIRDDLELSAAIYRF